MVRWWTATLGSGLSGFILWQLLKVRLLKDLYYVKVSFRAYYILKERGNEQMKAKKHLGTTTEELMVSTVYGRGSSNLKALREETAKKRQQLADEYYNKVYEENKRKETPNDSKT